MLRRPVDESLYSAAGVQRYSLDESLSRSADWSLPSGGASGSWTMKVCADFSALNRSTDRSTATTFVLY